MSPRCRSLLWLPLLLLAVLPAHAVTIEDLHTASVDVPDKSGEARREAFRTGLERVLVKVSGTAAVLDRPGVAGLLESPAELVQQYRYESIEPDPTATDDAADVDAGAGAEDGDADDGPRFRLIATFAGGRIERRLEELDIVVWGRQRPEILVWLAVDDRSSRRILAADGNSAAHRALRDAAERRALPVLLPLMDAQDRSRVEFVDISGGFHDAVLSASERYRGDIVLVGHVRRSGAAWRADWTLLGLGERRAWSAGGDAIEAAVAGGVNGATERLAATLAGKGGERRRARARVLGVDSLGAYARVSAYFEGLVRVESARLHRVTADELVFDLAIEGRIDEFERAVALGDTLVRAEATPEGPDASAADAGAGGEADAGATTEPATGNDDAGGAADPASGDDAAAADAAEADGAPVPELVFRLAD